MNEQTLTKKQFWLFFILVLFLSCFTIISFHPGNLFIIGDDGYFHLNRFAALGEAIYSGNFPFYIDSYALEGYGYATNLFYPDFMLIPFALLIPVTGIVWAFKIMLIFYTILCALFSYFAAKRVTSNVFIAMVFAILYTFSYYRIADTSFRTALGEFLAFTFIPLVLWGIYEILCGKVHRWYILSIAFACLILSHLVSTLLLFLVMCCLLLVFFKCIVQQPKRILYFLLAGVTTVFLVAFFIFPMYEQMQTTDFYYKTSPYVQEIKYSGVSFHRVMKGFLRGLTAYIRRHQDSYIGVGAILTALLLFRIFIRKKDKTPIIRLADIFTIAGFFFIFMITKLFPWGIFPFDHLKIIQFPWRLFQPISFLFAFSGAVYFVSVFNRVSERNKKKYIFISCSLLLVVLVWGTINTSKAFYKIRNDNVEVNHYKGGDTKNLNYIGVGKEYLPSKVPSMEYILERGDKIVSKDSETNINNFKRENRTLSFDVILADQADSLELPLLFYKGYKAVQDNQNLPVTESQNGLIQIPVGKTGPIIISYHGTCLQRITLLLSSLTLVILLLFILRRYYIKEI